MAVLVNFPDGAREVDSYEVKSQISGSDDIVVVDTPQPDPAWHFLAVIDGWIAKHRP